MTKAELVAAAIAAMNARRAEAEQKRLEELKRDQERNSVELAGILAARPELADYNPNPTPNGIWIELPECWPIRMNAWGGTPEHQSFGIAASVNAYPRNWSHDLAETIEKAHNAFLGN